MPESHHFLTNLALVLCVAAVTSLLFQRLHQPVVFGYLFAGMLIGPHIPVPLVADEGLVHTLAELGVILLMFALGLEFSLPKLFRVAPTAGIIALLQCSAMIFFGFGLGRLFGWTVLESVYTGAIIAISSTTIILKAFAEQKVSGKVTEIVFGILIIEDLIGILLIAMLMAVSSAGNLSPWELTRTSMRLAAFLVGLIAIGLLTVPRLIRATVRLGSPETTLVTAIGISFATALLALSFGYSVALGAFIGGSLVAESGRANRAPGRTRARHVRRRLLRGGGNADRSGPDRRALAARSRPDPRGDRRKGHLRVGRLVSRRLRHPDFGPDGDEPGTDR
jgi:CPA2 family monovalent cation:H+ antiporter-2